MPKKEIVRIAGTNHTIYADPIFAVLTGTTNAPYASLKAIDAPRGSDGPIAILITRAAAGTLSSSATCPTRDHFVWINDDASDEDGSTILIPGLDATLTDTFTIPTADSTTTANVTVDSTEHLAVGDTVYITAIGYFVVSSITSTTVFVVTNDGATGNTGAGGTAASGAFVTRVPATGPKAGRWMLATYSARQ